jgi:hypothetical protein
LQVHQQSQSDAFDKLHHEKHFVFGGPAEFEGADDIGVIQRERNFAFGGFIEPLEALFKALRFSLSSTLRATVRPDCRSTAFQTLDMLP